MPALIGQQAFKSYIRPGLPQPDPFTQKHSKSVERDFHYAEAFKECGL